MIPRAIHVRRCWVGCGPAHDGQHRHVIRYRPDIDGLRGLAVAAVVLFHADVPGFPGGFVGVDVFFVISGYLITSMIAGGIDDGTFSLRQFYERRARRILPALLCVLLVTGVVALLLLWPAQLRLHARDLLANLTFSANVVYWRSLEYFSGQGSRLPLLHTWSLGVEEQFYFVFPLAMLWVSRTFPGRRSHVVGAALVASLALCIFLAAGGHYQAAFYLLPSRAWQLLAGSVLALSPSARVSGQRTGQVLSLAGLVGLAVVVVTYRGDDYPGWAAIAPTLCAAAIVAGASGPETITGRVLRSAPLVQLGLISYSLYLWHWPLLVFARSLELRAPPLAVSGLAVAMSLVLAALSWRFVETPARSRAPRFPFGRLARAFAAGAVGIVLIAATAWQTDGLPQRFAPEVRRWLEDLESEKADLRRRCANRDPSGRRLAGACPLGSPDAVRSSFVLIGDSHSLAASPVFDSVARTMGRKGELVWMAGCPPLLDSRVTGGPERPCSRLLDDEFRRLDLQGPTNFILVANWRAYVDSSRGRVVSLRSADGQKLEGSDAAIALEQALGVTIDSLRSRGNTVYVMRDVPSYPFSVPERVARRVLDGGLTVEVGQSRDSNRGRLAVVTPIFDRLISANRGVVFDPSASFCTPVWCAAADSIASFYFDGAHLTRHGAEQLRPMVTELFSRFR